MSASRPALDDFKHLAILRYKLCESIDKYLTNDNPEPAANAGFIAKATAAAVSLYSRKGVSGRVRARAYKAGIESSKESVNALFLRVTNDIKLGSSPLSTSSKLRDRLLEGLCEFFEISKDQIEVELDKTRRGFVNAMAFAGAQAYSSLPSEADMRRSAIFILLAPSITSAKAEVNLEQSREQVIDSAREGRDNKSLIGDMSL